MFFSISTIPICSHIHLPSCNDETCHKTCRLQISSIILFVTQTGADPYIIAKCEKESVRIPTVEDTQNPEWDRSALFFKTDRDSQIEIEVCHQLCMYLLSLAMKENMKKIVGLNNIIGCNFATTVHQCGLTLTQIYVVVEQLDLKSHIVYMNHLIRACIIHGCHFV